MLKVNYRTVNIRKLTEFRMKYLVLIILLCGCSSIEDITNLEGKVEVKSDPYSIGSLNFSDTYEAKDSKCGVKWELKGNASEASYSLWLKYDYKKRCSSFKTQISEHKLILSKIFSQKSVTNLKYVNTPSFHIVEPSYKWNQKIAVVSLKSKLWKDYVENYPNHKSGRSSNSMFIEFANQVNASEAFLKLFEYYSVSLKLTSVEKVFVQKVLKLPFKIDAVASKQKVMYDAGVMYYEVQELN